MNSEDEVEIITYEPWVLDGLARLRSRYEDNEAPDASKALLERRFFHEYSKDRSLIITALVGEKIAGMQTYTYWPYRYSERDFYSVQSGLTLVDEEYRGKRLFLRMLEKGHEILRERGVDFVMGFPGNMSYEGFIKDGWSHIGTPMFMIRPLKPLKLLSYRPGPDDNKTSSDDWEDRQGSCQAEELASRIRAAKYRVDSVKAICMKPDPAFLEYRYAGRETKYKIYGYRNRQQETVFICKMFFFKGFNALGIGDIQVRDISEYSLSKAVEHLIKDVREEGNIDAIAILIKSCGSRVVRTLAKKGFLPFPSQRTPFIVKPVCMKASDAELIKDYSKWSIMLADKDTWYIRGIYS